MCLDYRKVNTHLVTDIHPLPHLDELVENVAGNSYYATLDLTDAYYQMELHESSKDLTTFTEGVNLYRFKRLPFGLSCSASLFVRQLQKALAPLLQNRWVKSYLDDIIVCAPSYNILLQRLGQAFEQMQDVGIKLNLSKCKMGLQEVKFLGHVVNAAGYRPDPANIEAVTGMRPPSNIKEVRRFLGMAGFSRRHVETFSKITAPLSDLTCYILHLVPSVPKSFRHLEAKTNNSPRASQSRYEATLCPRNRC